MLRFAIIAEGPTDQVVIKSILVGYFKDDSGEPAVNRIQPPPERSEHPGGWGHVFKSLQREDYKDALQVNDYIVVHIDTDVQEESGYDVPRKESGADQLVPERVDRVIARLKREIDPVFFEANKDRFIFAIAVDTIVCWLLPLFHDDERKAEKTTGCLDAMNKALAKANLASLSSRDKYRAYAAASKDYLKRKTLLSLRDKNPSLEIFISQLHDIVGKQTTVVDPPSTPPPPQTPVINPPLDGSPSE